MRRFFSLLIFAVLFSAFAAATPSQATRTPVKAHHRDSRVQRHRTHKAGKHNTRKRLRHHTV